MKHNISGKVTLKGSKIWIASPESWDISVDGFITYRVFPCIRKSLHLNVTSVMFFFLSFKHNISFNRINAKKIAWNNKLSPINSL